MNKKVEIFFRVMNKKKSGNPKIFLSYRKKVGETIIISEILSDPRTLP